MTRLQADGITLEFDPGIGQIVSFEVEDDGVAISPLHVAPWVVRNETLPAETPGHMKTLGGDFFCAPFGATEDGSPLHGWPANSPWQIDTRSQSSLRGRLERPVMGATIEKEITLRAGHPFVYQRHVITGGQGNLPVANHANLSVPNGALIRTSPKAVWVTPPNPQESDPAMGRSGLIYPEESDDPRRFPALTGTADLTEYPWFDRHEDFVVGIDAGDQALAWTAVSRPFEGDLYLSLRRTAEMPLTMLWHSNGGRDYPPWSGRHFGCLGVEEGAAAHILGVEREVPLPGPASLLLSQDTRHEVHHVIGAVRWPAGCPVRDVVQEGNELRIDGEDGSTRRVPFDPNHLTGRADT